MHPEKRLKDLDISLPEPPEPIGIYKPFLLIGDHIYLSGHGPYLGDGTFILGRVGDDMNKEEARMAARQTALAMLSTLKTNLGNLDRVDRVIKIFGMVSCIPSFQEHPYVINGCSQLFADLFGKEKGIGARSAVGMGSLPDAMTLAKSVRGPRFSIRSIPRAGSQVALRPSVRRLVR